MYAVLSLFAMMLLTWVSAMWASFDEGGSSTDEPVAKSRAAHMKKAA